jgi:hypothetical protein
MLGSSSVSYNRFKCLYYNVIVLLEGYCYSQGYTSLNQGAGLPQHKANTF